MKNNILAPVVGGISFLTISIIAVFYIIGTNIESLAFSLILSLIIIFIVIKLLKKAPSDSNEPIFEKSDNIIDTLTNLPNRKKFFEDLEKAKGIVLIDLDDFSILNIVYSREVGDEFLKKLSHKLIQSSCIDNLYHLGGDEFAYISYTEKDLKTIAECMQEIINNFYLMKDNIMIQLTATIAITYTPPFIETADIVLKYGKKNKLNIIVYSRNLNIFEENQLFADMTMRIKQALKSDNIVPFFHCIKDRDENTVRYEALMRIKEKEKYILPATFLDIAKKTKLYSELTSKMITKTFVYMQDKDIPFSINISYDDIVNKRIFYQLLAEIDNFHKPENVIIELLETEKIDNFDYVKYFIDEIHKKGAKIAIDDFGSGYSNFIYLEKLNVDIIKIDGEIVSEILSSDNALFLVRTIVEFCKKNNITSIAEFVSHREIYLELKEMGVDEYQGFYFCKPKENIE